MTVRNVSIRLTADTASFTARMRAAGVVASETFTKANLIAAKQKQAINDLGTTAGKAGLVMGAAVGAAVFAAANFDQAMSRVAAATHESASNMDSLRAAALKAGKDTVFSATEAAGAVTELAKAGVSTGDILGGGLSGALSLASAGELDVSAAADAAATAMNQFGLAGSQVPHIADLLAAAAGKAQGEVSDMAMALKQGGLVAHQAGLSLEETTGALAAFAAQGLIGSDAGTSFKTFLQSLTPVTDKAQTAMESIGFSAYDAQGNFVGLTNVAGQLRNGLKKMSDEQKQSTLKTIFGSDAVRAASVIYDQGATGIQNWIDKVNDQGFAAETAALKMDNLKGDLEQLKGSLETALIGTGDGAQGPLRQLVQQLTTVTNAYIGLPGPVKNGGLAIAAFLAVVGGGAFVASRMIGALTGIRTNITLVKAEAAKAGIAIKGMNTSALAVRGAAGLAGMALMMADFGGETTQASGSLSELSDIAGPALLGFSVGGPWGAALGGGIGLVTKLASSFTATSEAAKTARIDSDQFVGSLSASIKILETDYKSLQGTLENTSGVDAFLNPLGSFSLDSKLDEDQKKLDELRTNYEVASNTVNNLLSDLGGSPEEFSAQFAGAAQALTDAGFDLTQNLSGSDMDRARAVLQGYYDDQENAGSATQVTADAVDKLGDSFATSGDKAASLVDALKAINEGALGSRASLRDYEAAKDSLDEQLDQRKELIANRGTLVSDLGDAQGELSDAQGELSKAKNKAEREAAQSHIDSAEGQIQDIQDRLRDNAKDLDSYKITLNAGVDAGRRWQDTLDGMATAALKHAEDMKIDGKHVNEINGFLVQSRKHLIDVATQFFHSKAKAREYVDEVLKIPPNITTAIRLENQKAKWLKDYEESLRRLDGKHIDTFITGHIKSQRTDVNAELLGLHAAGGYITGPGTATSDSIPARLSNGEFVMRAAAVAKYGVDNMQRMNSMRFADGGFVGTSAGGGGGSFDLGSKFDRLASRVEMLASRGNGVTFTGPMHVNNGRDLLTRADASRQQAAGV